MRHESRGSLRDMQSGLGEGGSKGPRGPRWKEPDRTGLHLGERDITAGPGVPPGFVWCDYPSCWVEGGLWLGGLVAIHADHGRSGHGA